MAGQNMGAGMDGANRHAVAFADLTALFEAAGERQEVARRARLQASGARLNHAFLVVSGWFGRSRTGPGGAEAFTAVYMAGDAIGLDALPDGCFADEVTALSPGVVLRLPLVELRRAVAEQPAVAAEVVRVLSHETRLLREALVAVGTQSSVQRLSTFLVQTHDRLVAMRQIAPGAPSWPLPLTQGQLGAVLGLTSVHVNRVLKVLSREGVLELRSGMVLAFDADALRRRSQHAG